ncbi:interferon-induced protein 44-like isoform X2 [Pecten maximus]|uniref:interferon-induced protein 44-like isoform X2 n=1 Tax=Pecten maximus TaxID=6579 RepID=UPI00145825AB|nr:interferon-induced protein 44-like isoform X2 [Pecten maximus]
MESKLTQVHKDQLSKWINPLKRHKFTLLYKISRDGCDAQTFHRYCDKKGPTVTVLYNTDNSVYGGYTAVSWNSDGDFITDDQAFLFSLDFNGKAKPMLFRVKDANKAIYGNDDSGPVFGEGHALDCFTGTVAKSGNVFPLNGDASLGTTYDMLGQDCESVTNGHLNVLELRVYSVKEKTAEEQKEEEALLERQRRARQLTEKPWIRNIEWSPKLEETLKNEVASYETLSRLNVKQAMILLVGQVGAGKSSYFNTINSIFRGQISIQANAGSADKSLTTSFRKYQIRHGPDCTPLKFRLCDTRGLEEDDGLDGQEICYLLDGHVPEKYKFNPSVPLTPDVTGFVKNPTLSERMHCVVFVIDASTVDVMPKKVMESIKAIQTRINQRGIPQAVLLTHIDGICEPTSEDLSKVYFSVAVKECAEKVSMMMGLPQQQVFPVKNYHREADLEQNVNILSLRSLRKILNFVDDFLYNKLDDIETEKGGQRDY